MEPFQNGFVGSDELVVLLAAGARLLTSSMSLTTDVLDIVVSAVDVCGLVEAGRDRGAAVSAVALSRQCGSVCPLVVLLKP